VGRTAGDESQLLRKFEKNDKKCKLILIAVRVYITSLNAQFHLLGLGTNCWGRSMVSKSMVCEVYLILRVRRH
jgi:hypothetical protein